MSVRVGISGWRYKGWRGTFYPEDLLQRRELAYAAGLFPTIELNGSFYSLQKARSYRQWYAETPEHFVFSVKAPRFLTHVKRLREIDGPFANFLASGVLALEEKLGPLLWQFPPNFRWQPELFESFLQALPRTTAQAAMLARDHDHRVADPHLEVLQSRPLRHAVEVRHASFIDPALVDQLRRHQVALVAADTAGLHPVMHDLTADFVYVRLHGDTELYSSGYGDQALRAWARRIGYWERGEQSPDAVRVSGSDAPVQPRDVYVYFDNDAKVHAPFDAQSLIALLKRPRARR
ncbi:DUF72 domain-containing protein [Dyella sp.]|uniref:DUF72 domain-containing protein n=1 Tax=Dyella sp. TaxID=1869338 RepID=UPI002D7856DE|nr:DUF72 domain-containing protein [Dyella sp.]HET6433118.1 DUF72 domain-containing protein [Dyella sp.]